MEAEDENEREEVVDSEEPLPPEFLEDMRAIMGAPAPDLFSPLPNFADPNDPYWNPIFSNNKQSLTTRDYTFVGTPTAEELHPINAHNAAVHLLNAPDNENAQANFSKAASNLYLGNGYNLMASEQYREALNDPSRSLMPGFAQNELINHSALVQGDEFVDSGTMLGSGLGVGAITKAPTAAKAATAAVTGIFDEIWGRATGLPISPTILLGRGKPKTASNTSTPSAANKITTKEGIAVQSSSPEALQLRTDVEAGQQIYRGGNFPRSKASDAQFFSPKNPLSLGFADNIGAANLDTRMPDFIMGGTVRPVGNFITRPAPGFGSNAGGGLEIVNDIGAIEFDFFVMPD